MRINQITEAKFSKPTVAFHGTSSAFLKSILKTGMNPNPKNKKWDTDPNARSDRHSLVSLTGTYWTTNLYTATKSASNTSEKFGGNKLYVIANIQLGSAKSDEDDIMGSFEREYIYALKQFTNPEYTTYLLNLYTEYPDSYQKAKEIFTKEYHNYITKNQNKPIPEKLLSAAFDANTFRKFAYENNLIKYDLEMYQKNNKIGEIPDKSQAEQTLRNIKEKLTIYYREPIKNSFDQKFRITNPITFRGNNRITHILELVDKDTDGTIFKLKYGNAKNIPIEFLKHFTNISVIDQNNNLLKLYDDELKPVID